MTGNETHRDKIRAVFLAAIMVLSVVALSATFAGAAVAQEIADADRTVDDAEVAPGASTTVTVDVTLEEEDDLFVAESFDPAFEDVEITDDDGADFSGVNDANDEAFASWGDVEEVTLVYDVTVPSDAEAGDEFEISSDESSDADIEADTITVADEEPPEDYAVTFEDQPSLDGESVFVDEAAAGAGEQLAIWTEDDDGNPSSVIATETLEDGTADDLVVALDDPIEEDQDLTAAVHSTTDADDVSVDNAEATASAFVEFVEADQEIPGPDQTPTHWAGQILLLQGDFTAGQDYQVREVDGAGDNRAVGDLAREVRAVADGQLIVFTDDLDSGLHITETDEQRYSSGDTLASSLDDEPGFGFEIAIQTLDVSDVQPSVVTNETFNVGEIDSIRSSYDLAVTAVNDDGDEFPLTTLTNLGDRETDVQLDARDIDDEPLDPDDYTLMFNVTDTTASDSADLEVTEQLDEEVTIASPDPADEAFQRGDIIPVVLEFQGTDTGTLTFGDRQEGQAVEINATVTDTDGSGTATVLVNTFQIGDEDRNHGIVAAPGGAAEVDVENATMDDRLGGSAGGAVIASTGYDLVSVAGDEPWKDATIDDRSIARVTERGSEDIEVWTAPGTGENELDVDTVDEIEDAIEDELVTPADGAVADNDFLILQLQSTGLEGVLHEAAMLTQEQDIADDQDGEFTEFKGEADALEAATFLLDREDSHDVGEQWFNTDLVRQSTGAGDGDLLALETVQADPGPNISPYTVALEELGEGVFAGTDESGNLDEYFVPILLDSENTDIVEPEDRELRPGDTMDSTFTVQSPAQEGEHVNFPSNLFFVEGLDDDGQSTEVTEVSWDFLPDTADIDREGDVLMVPLEDDVDIDGTTNVAAGTNLSVQFATVSGEDDPFFKPTSAKVQYEEGQLANSWSVTEDFGDSSVGTEFSVRITRAGGPGTVMTDGDARDGEIPGLITDEPAVNEFVFDDQRSGGSTVMVNTFNTTQGGYIGIYTADGDRIGMSSFQDVGEQNRVAISLDEDITENQDLTATAYRTQDRAYTDEDGDLIQRTAHITIEDLDPAEFSVSDLDPQAAELDEPGEVIDVSATITNDGDEDGTTDVELRLDGDTLDSESVTLDGGESTTVTFEADTSELDYGTSYTHSVWTADDEAAGTLTIADEPTPTPTPEEPTPTPEPPADDTDDADDDGAGFGVIVALLAFLGAALLAVRRQVRE